MPTGTARGRASDTATGPPGSRRSAAAAPREGPLVVLLPASRAAPPGQGVPGLVQAGQGRSRAGVPKVQGYRARRHRGPRRRTRTAAGGTPSRTAGWFAYACTVSHPRAPAPARARQGVDDAGAKAPGTPARRARSTRRGNPAPTPPGRGGGFRLAGCGGRAAARQLAGSAVTAQGGSVQVSAGVFSPAAPRRRRYYEMINAGGVERPRSGRSTLLPRKGPPVAVPSSFEHRSTGDSFQRGYWLARACHLAHKSREAIEEQAGARGFEVGSTPRDAKHSPRPAPGHPGPRPGRRPHDHHGVVRHKTGPDQSLALGRHHVSLGPGPGGTGWVHHGLVEALEAIYRRSKTPRPSRAPTAGSCSPPGTASPGPSPCRPERGRIRTSRGRPPTASTPTAGPAPVTRSRPRRTTRASPTACTGSSITTTSCPDCRPSPASPMSRPCAVSTGRDGSTTGMPLLGGLVERAQGMTADPLAPAGDGIRDHFMNNYIAVLEKNLS